MGLFVIQHLDPMLKAAQFDVGLGQFDGDGGRYVAGSGQRGQGLVGAMQPQRVVAAAEDQLLGLGVEFDLANAAPAEFQIGPGRLQTLAGLVGVDLSLDRLDVEHGLVVKAAAPDEGGQGVEEFGCGGRVAT